MLTLDTPHHGELARILRKTEGIPGEMSIRPRIQRAIAVLLETNNPELIPEDIRLMWAIAGNPPANINGAYEQSLRNLAQLCQTEDTLYGGEAEWSRNMLALSEKTQ